MAPFDSLFGLPKILANILLIESHMTPFIFHIGPFLIKTGDPGNTIWKTIFDLDLKTSIFQDFNEVIGMNIELKFIFIPGIEIEIQTLKSIKIHVFDMGQWILGHIIEMVGIERKRSISLSEVSSTGDPIEPNIHKEFTRIMHLVSIEIRKRFMELPEDGFSRISFPISVEINSQKYLHPVTAGRVFIGDDW